MKVTVYDAADVTDELVPIDNLPVRTVEPGPDDTVADVLEAAGLPGLCSFTLVTTEIAHDVLAGEADPIESVYSLFGMRPNGEVYILGAPRTPWNDFVRAHEAGLYQGEVTQLVVYPFGVAGGPLPDGLQEIVDYLLQHPDLVVGALALANVKRRQFVAERWRKSGFTAARIRRYLRSRKQWDPEHLQREKLLTDKEARLALHNAGYSESDDGLWRLNDSTDSVEKQQAIKEIEDRAEDKMNDEL